MLDINFIRENPQKVKDGVKSRGLDPSSVDRVIKVDETRRQLIAEIEKWRSERNKLSHGEKATFAKATTAKGKKIKEMLRRLDPDLKAVEEELRNLVNDIPNLPADDVSIGKDDSENVEIKKWGTPAKFTFKPKDHLDIGEALDIIDVKRAAKVSGSRFAYFKAAGALLEFSLMWYVFDKLAKKGFVPTIPPVITRKEIEKAMGYSEHGGWEQAYLFEKDEAVFVSSSEHSVIPMHKDEVLPEKQLPLRYVNFSTCFRREAGTYGKDTRGVFRVHQFNKVEMNSYTLPDLKVSDKECLYLLSLQEEIVQDLEIPYRVINCCTGDLPLPNRRMYDLQCWFPGQNKYRETHSCSNCSDYQTRRLNIKVKTRQGNNFLHALNATAITDRAVLAILENYQQKDGSVLIPKVLQKYTDFEKIAPLA